MPSAFPFPSLPILAMQEAAPAGEGQSMLPSLLMFGTIGAIFYFLLIRPQAKAEKTRRAMLESIKKKDRIVTSGGLIGTVSDVRDDELTVRISENPDVKIRVRRSAVVEIQRETAEPAAK
jgi:preprotein translocase subunit YajC